MDCQSKVLKRSLCPVGDVLVNNTELVVNLSQFQDVIVTRHCENFFVARKRDVEVLRQQPRALLAAEFILQSLNSGVARRRVHPSVVVMQQIPTEPSIGRGLRYRALGTTHMIASSSIQPCRDLANSQDS